MVCAARAIFRGTAGTTRCSPAGEGNQSHRTGVPVAVNERSRCSAQTVTRKSLAQAPHPNARSPAPKFVYDGWIIELYTPTIAPEVPRKIDAGTASRLRTLP